ncbi:synapsin [Wyeomyia smithii]|uniref:synapsin n=1 Tax=Wyeomyia smithii TaxID=174621 RepID=UPI002467B40D|nr:synapsin [Wyeomyia smithii]
MPGGPPNIPPPPAPAPAVSPGTVPGSAPPTGGPELSLSFGKGPQRGTSAPSSPAKSRESLLQRVQSLTGAARDQGASIIGAAVSSATRVQPFNKDKCFTLLVLDDQNTDWSKYFRGKRLHGDFDIRVEQAEFREISLTANADAGPLISFIRGSSKQPKSFRPDFILVRQAPRDGTKDYRSTLLGLKYGGVPSINSLHSLYQFQEKPWVFAHLLQLQRRLGRDGFPLVEQTFFPNPQDMLTWQKFPCVLKAGHCHGGVATAKLDNPSALQDAAGLLRGAGVTDASYCSLEPYIDAKFDVHIQKIGVNYKAFMRKSISGNWKTNQGSAMLEQIPMTEKYKTWIDEVSELFGGMEVCGVAIIVSKEGKEFIISASDSTFPLMGDTQEEDRRQIADLVVGRMQNVCRPSIMTKASSRTSISSRGGSPSEETPPVPIGTRPVPVGGGPPPIPERTTPGVGSIGRHGSFSSQSGDQLEQPIEKAPVLNNVGRRDSQASQSSSVSGISSASAARSNKIPGGQASVVDEAEDTMKNLRKTFAGIFGDM